jgi:hypothetical protein
LRRFIVACAATVEDQQHEPAADNEGEENTETHHQPAPCRHGHIASRDPPVVAYEYRPNEKGEKNGYDGNRTANLLVDPLRRRSR